MSHPHPATLFLSAACILGGLLPCAAADAESLFNGKDLSGWEGDPAFWNVEEGAITGASSAAHPCKKSNWLILKDRKVGNFELTAKFRFLSDWGNSGIQYRSAVADSKAFAVKGYQADLAIGQIYTGILYEQGGRGILVNRGDKAEIAGDGTRKIIEHFDEAKPFQKLEKGRWYTLHIVAKGTHLIQEIDGIRTMEVTDADAKHRAVDGCLALQLHQGPAMKVQFKDIELKEFPAAEAAGDQAPGVTKEKK